MSLGGMLNVPRWDVKCSLVGCSLAICSTYRLVRHACSLVTHPKAFKLVLIQVYFVKVKRLQKKISFGKFKKLF